MQLPATVTMGDAAAVLAALGDDVETIDASALASLDTAAVAVLLEASRRAAARGRRLVVTGAPAKLRALVRLYGVEGLLPLDDGRSGAST